MSAWRTENLERAREIERQYKQSPKGQATQLAYERRRGPRRRENPIYRVESSLRRRVNFTLKGERKSASTLELLGCSFDCLKAWITFYFQPGMSWTNYGKVWHIDHIRPCSSFDLSSQTQQKECFHYTNLQPLFVIENLKKGAQWPVGLHQV